MEKLIVLNHKSKLNIEQVKDYIKNIKDNIRNDVEVVVMPSMCYLPLFYGKYNFKLGSQNIGYVNGTGEVLPNQLKSMNVSYCMIGHSERKMLYNESYDIINKRVKIAIDNNIKPIICIGETLAERKRKKTQEVLVEQIKKSLRDIDIDQDISIAYEPIWAIGTGNVPSKDEIVEVVNLIKNVVYKISGKNIRVLYGGSVDDVSINDLVGIKELDGFLIGGASVDSNKTIRIINSI